MFVINHNRNGKLKELILKIADLQLVINPVEQNLSLDYSPCHRKFTSSERETLPDDSSLAGKLVLDVVDTPDPPGLNLTRLLCENEIWQLWLDGEGNYVFTQPKQIPQRWTVIEPEFQFGRTIGDFSGFNQREVYPLQFIDIVVYSNWLAKFGDMILHASGITFGGEGYCFIGDSGAGKSTLARDLLENPGVRVLGEDQVILRRKGSQFMIFGTPWHESTEMCSPEGVPLKKVFFLDRNAARTITPVGGFDAVVQIVRTAFYPIYRADAVERILGRLSDLPGQVKFFSLAYHRGTDVLRTIVDA